MLGDLCTRYASHVHHQGVRGREKRRYPKIDDFESKLIFGIEVRIEWQLGDMPHSRVKNMLFVHVTDYNITGSQKSLILIIFFFQGLSLYGKDLFTQPFTYPYFSTKVSVTPGTYRGVHKVSDHFKPRPIDMSSHNFLGATL